MEEITVVKYKSIDGKIFNHKSECENHETWLKHRQEGNLKTCPKCNGTRQIDPYMDGRVFVTCDKCKGKGYLVKTEVWV